MSAEDGFSGVLVARGTVQRGDRPTFYGSDGQRLLEAHVLDFDREIFGELVRLPPVQYRTVRGGVACRARVGSSPRGRRENWLLDDDGATMETKQA
ncbi:MAG: hypothetical protein ACI9DE_001108 [Halioglobus sp.]